MGAGEGRTAAWSTLPAELPPGVAQEAQAIAAGIAEALHLEGILAVEMEAAALYALAIAKHKDIICFAHVTNTMAQTLGDFEKGENDGSTATLALVVGATRLWRAQRTAMR